jgi:hypothetical protein
MLSDDRYFPLIRFFTFKRSRTTTSKTGHKTTASSKLSIFINRRKQMTELTIIRLVDPRPEDVPADHPIFNAPRPLIGDRCWQGEFRHGIFYASVNIAVARAERCTRDNISIDGWLCEFAARTDVEKWGREYAATFDIRNEDHPYEIWEETWHQNKRIEKCNPDEYLKSLFIQTDASIVHR